MNDYGHYDATLRPWYKDGVACGRQPNSRFGNLCVSAVYVASHGEMLLNLVQPFYDSSYALKGDQNAMHGCASHVAFVPWMQGC